MRDDGDDVVARARRGDEDAWAELYAAYARRLRVWLTTLLAGDAATADDLAAEAWLVAARRLADFTGDADAFGGWLFGIGRRLLLGDRRTRARRATSPVPVDVGDGGFWGVVPDPSGRVAEEDRVRRLLALLPAREAEVLACVDVVGLDVSATAAALDISTVAVRVARHRGLNRLRAILDPGAASGAAPAARRPRRV